MANSNAFESYLNGSSSVNQRRTLQTNEREEYQKILQSMKEEDMSTYQVHELFSRGEFGSHKNQSTPQGNRSGGVNHSGSLDENTPLLRKSSNAAPGGGPIDTKQIQADYLALIVDGDTLMAILGDKINELLFLSVARICKAVIACRVSPQQKRLLCRLVDKTFQPRPVTLAIGDGANDVAMIQEAQIGIGISGKEGRQAVNSADFAIAQFSYLKRLLMVHGRLNYRRTSKLIRFTFYKNIIAALVIFFFTFYSGYSGGSLFEDNVFMMYNVALAAPSVALGIFDRDRSISELLTDPSHYAVGRKRMDLNSITIIIDAIAAVIDALILYYIPHYVYETTRDIWSSHGYTAGIWVFGTTVYLTMILAMFMRYTYIASTWTYITHVFFWTSLAAFFVYILIYQYMYFISYIFYGVANEMLGSSLFWSILAIVLAIMHMSQSLHVTVLASLQRYREHVATLDTRILASSSSSANDAEHNAKYFIGIQAMNTWLRDLPIKVKQSLGLESTPSSQTENTSV